MESVKAKIAVVAALYFLLSVSPPPTHAQNLTAVKCNGVLPSARAYFAILYDDNDDSIYLFGGHNGSSPYFDDVIKYSISLDSTELVGQLPYPDFGGSVVRNKLGHFFYLSGRAGAGIHRYIPDLRSFVNVSSLPQDNFYFATTILPDNDTALLFGGYSASRSVLSLNLTSLESKQLAPLPEAAFYPAAIWAADKDSAFIFNHKSVLKYHPSGNGTEKLSLELPLQSENYGMAWDGRRYAYLTGVIEDGYPAQSLVRFDADFEVMAFVPVEGLVPLDAATAIYIEKLDRIYLFGGYQRKDDGGELEYLDGIWYIDMGPLTEQQRQ